MKLFPSTPVFLALLGLFILLIHSSCEKDNGDPSEWPATFEDAKADYIGPGEVYLMADISGTISGITELGFCWSVTSPPETSHNTVTVTPGPGIFSYALEGLESGTTYYVRPYYIFDNSTYYGDIISFKTTTPVEDNDGNSYRVIQIGNRLWTGENLRVSTYNNGDSIPDGTGKGNYSGMQNPKFFFHYDDDPENNSQYGKLYTWYTISDTRRVCPPQWRVPDIMDWEQLIKHLDALSDGYHTPDQGAVELSAIAGGMLRQAGTLQSQTGLWQAPNTGANNVTGMTLLPSGLRDPSGAFDGIGFNAAFWSFTEETSNSAIMIYSHYFNPGIYANHFVKSSGYAVRCVRNAP